MNSTFSSLESGNCRFVYYILFANVFWTIDLAQRLIAHLLEHGPRMKLGEEISVSLCGNSKEMRQES